MQRSKWLVLLGLAGAISVSAADYATLPGGTLRTALPVDEKTETVAVAPFQMRTLPVTNAEFASFVRKNTEWQRAKAPAVFTAANYLTEWKTPLDYAPLLAQAPVVNVSWYAAKAFCDTENARLPTWYEWEFAAAADETRTDARRDPAWRTRILSWYEKPTSQQLPAVGKDAANVYGIHNLHQMIWEWVDDYNGLFVTVDSRSQGVQALMESCGAAALTMGDKENYAVLMRIALLSALNGRESVSSLGFRCVRNGP